jgi:hypothetical protein
MLPGSTVPSSLLALLQVLRPCFTAPTFRTFSALVIGLAMATRQWSPDQLGLALVRLIVERLLPEGAALDIAVDDTLFKRRGKKVYGAAWQHDGSATGAKKTGFGNNWVVLRLLVPLPFLDRPVCLPVLARLWRPKSAASKVELARRLVGLLLTAFPTRELRLVGDAAYYGKALRDLPARCS